MTHLVRLDCVLGHLYDVTSLGRRRGQEEVRIGGGGWVAGMIWGGVLVSDVNLIAM